MSSDTRAREARSLIRAGLSAAEAAALAGCTIEAATTKGSTLGALPTPQQIELRAAQIRKRWSPAERERRRVCMIEGWTVPRYRDAG